MKDAIDRATLEALGHYGGAATEEFFTRLRWHKLSTTRCEACKEVAFPPRTFCPSCRSSRVEWIDLPTRGKLYAFTTHDKSVRFNPPDVIGLVELEGVGRILTRIDAPLASLKIGQEVELDFVEVTPDLVLHQFRPVS
jgi:uncharacterized OB-fold protein